MDDGVHKLLNVVSNAALLSAGMAARELEEGRIKLESNEREVAGLRRELERARGQENEGEVWRVVEARGWGGELSYPSADASPARSAASPARSATSPARSASRAPQSPASRRSIDSVSSLRRVTPAPVAAIDVDEDFTGRGERMHVAQPGPFFVVGGSHTHATTGPAETTPFTWCEPNGEMRFMREDDDRDSVQHDSVQHDSVQHGELNNAAPPPPPVMHPVLTKTLLLTPTTPTPPPNPDDFLDVLIATVLSDGAPPLPPTLPVASTITAITPSVDERLSRTLLLLEKTGETQRLNTEREMKMDLRESNLSKLEESIRKMVEMPFKNVGSPRKSKAVEIEATGRGGNPNSGSVQSVQGRAAPSLDSSHSGNSSPVRIRERRKKSRVSWEAVTVAPGASFEVLDGQLEEGVRFGDCATLVLEGNVDDIPIDFKDQVKGEISAALDVDFNQVEVLDVRSGSVLVDVRILAEDPDELLHALLKKCNEGVFKTGVLGKLISMRDSRGNEESRFRTNFSRLLKGGSSWRSLGVKEKIIEGRKFMEVGAGGWQFKKGGKGRTTMEVDGGEEMGAVSHMMGSGSEPRAIAEAGMSKSGVGVDLSVVVEEGEGASASASAGTSPFNSNWGRLLHAGSEFQEHELSPEPVRLEETKSPVKIEKKKLVLDVEEGDEGEEEKKRREEEAAAAAAVAAAESAAAEEEETRRKEEEAVAVAAGVEEEKEKEKERRRSEEAAAAVAAATAAAAAAAAAVAAAQEAQKVQSSAPAPDMSALIELAVKKEREASSRQISEMQVQLEATRRRLQEAQIRIDEQHKQNSKPPKLISVGVEFMDADVSMATSDSDTTDASEGEWATNARSSAPLVHAAFSPFSHMCLAQTRSGSALD